MVRSCRSAIARLAPNTPIAPDPGAVALEKIPVAVVTDVAHLTLPQANPIQSPPTEPTKPIRRRLIPISVVALFIPDPGLGESGSHSPHVTSSSRVLCLRVLVAAMPGPASLGGMSSEASSTRDITDQVIEPDVSCPRS
jgi:hypothetical protein